jgi:hypothetical protein
LFPEAILGPISTRSLHCHAENTRAHRPAPCCAKFLRYGRFRKRLPKTCNKLKRRPKDLTFADFSEMVEIWLEAAR